jgi:hypothetical protein
MNLLRKGFPEACLPDSFDAAMKYIRSMGLGYEKVHVCKNNCILFCKEKYVKLDVCLVCCEADSRWKDANTKKNIPQKVLRHFPLISRLKRMFLSSKTTKDAQWHQSKLKPVTNELSHPADGETWKEFNKSCPKFAEDARNLRLGLATDGINPFGNMNNSYSMWPVFVVSYNMPPWVCMEESNFMMTLLIPRPSSPSRDFDIFMEPLVKELQQLWKGVSAINVVHRKRFKLCVVVIWCIHDYPALSILSRRVTKGYFAYVRWDKDPCSRRLKN